MLLMTNIGYNYSIHDIIENNLLHIIYILLVTGFYITSADSQSLALRELIDPKSKVVFWVILEVIFAVIILQYFGENSIKSLQNTTFLIVPFMVLLSIIFIYYIIKHYVKK